jgi:hypothetical protein
MAAAGGPFQRPPGRPRMDGARPADGAVRRTSVYQPVLPDDTRPKQAKGRRPRARGSEKPGAARGLANRVVVPPPIADRASAPPGVSVHLQFSWAVSQILASGPTPRTCLAPRRQLYLLLRVAGTNGRRGMSVFRCSMRDPRFAMTQGWGDPVAGSGRGECRTPSSLSSLGRYNSWWPAAARAAPFARIPFGARSSRREVASWVIENASRKAPWKSPLSAI